MMPPIRTLLAHIRGVLAEQVLPELPPATWPAANIRSCVALLTYVEDALRLQPSLVPAQIAALRDIVDAALQQDDAAWLEQPLRATLMQLPPPPPPPPGCDSMHATHVAYAEAVSDVVRRSAGAVQRNPAFEALLRDRFALINTYEADLAEQAAQLAPF